MKARAFELASTEEKTLFTAFLDLTKSIYYTVALYASLIKLVDQIETFLTCGSKPIDQLQSVITVFFQSNSMRCLVSIKYIWRRIKYTVKLDVLLSEIKIIQPIKPHFRVTF